MDFPAVLALTTLRTSLSKRCQMCSLVLANIRVNTEEDFEQYPPNLNKKKDKIYLF